MRRTAEIAARVCRGRRSGGELREALRVWQGVVPKAVGVLLAIGVSFLGATGEMWAQGNPDYVLSVPDVTGVVGGQKTVSVILDFPNAADPLRGWSLGLCHDDLVDIDTVTDGSTTSALDPDFLSVNYYPGQGWTAGVVIDFFGVVVLQPGSGYVLHRATYDVLSEGTETLSFCSTLGSPPVSTILVRTDGSTLPPVQQNGTIDIGSVPSYVLHAGTAMAAPGDTVTVPVNLDNLTIVDGFSFGLLHDGALLNLVDLQAGAAVAATHGGAGPDFLHTDISPAGGAGGTVGCLISTHAPFEGIPAGSGSEIANFTYQVLGSAADGSESTLGFTGDLGSPAIGVTITVEGATEDVVVESGLVSIVGQPTVSFVRGDVDGDGSVGLTDVIFLATWVYESGPAGSCEDAGDINDDGNLGGVDDLVYLLNYLFVDGPAPTAPFPSCGVDPGADDGLGCDSFGGCP